MQLNTIKPGKGAKQPRKRAGRGIGSGLGKTCGRGHKLSNCNLSQNAVSGSSSAISP